MTLASATRATLGSEGERMIDHKADRSEKCKMHPDVILLCKTRVLNPLCPICVDDNIKRLSQNLKVLSDHFGGELRKDEAGGERKPGAIQSDVSKLKSFERFLKRQLTCKSCENGSSPINQALRNLASFRDGKDVGKSNGGPPVSFDDMISSLRADLLDAKERMLAYEGNKEAYHVAERALQETVLEMHHLAKRLVQHGKHGPFEYDVSRVQLQIELTQMEIVNVKCTLRRLAVEKITLKSVKELHLAYASLEGHIDGLAHGGAEEEALATTSPDASVLRDNGNTHFEQAASSPEYTSTGETEPSDDQSLAESQNGDGNTGVTQSFDEKYDLPVVVKEVADCRRPFSDALYACVDHLYMRADFQTTTVGDIIHSCEEAFGIKFNSYTKTLVMQRLKILYVEKPKGGPSLDSQEVSVRQT